MKIHDCVVRNDISGVAKELRRGVKVDVRDEHDMTSLALAASNRDVSIEMLRLLIDSGADVNAPVDKSLKFPIGLAALTGDLGKVKTLLDAGARVNASSPEGYTPLISVFYHEWGDPQRLFSVIDMLVMHGADIDAITRYGESPLTTAARQCRFEIVKYLLDAGATTDRLNWTSAIRATCLGTREELEQALAKDDAQSRDYFGRTAWLLSSEIGDIQKAALLRDRGADINERGRMGETALANCVGHGHVSMTRWLLDLGADVHQFDDFGNTPLMIAAGCGHAECVQELLKAGADPDCKNSSNDTALSMATNAAVIRLLVNAGQEITGIGKESRRLLTGMGGDEVLRVTRNQYLTGRLPRFGRSNPEEMNVPFWNEMIRAGINAYMAKRQFDDTDTDEKPVWCFDRFGTSFTELPDGRFVQIGGEHEDFYDPDFCIYNDVIVHEASGTFRIYGYPKEVFPPTDFHTATYVNGFIYIIGGMGYKDERDFGTTPVYRLNCQTWKIEKVETTGESPGWIFEHKARLENGDTLIISGGTLCKLQNGHAENGMNSKAFTLSLLAMKWS